MKTERFDTTLTKKEKDLFQRAAALVGFRSLSQFIRVAATEKAQSIIAEHQYILESDRDRQKFFETLDHIPDPAPALRELLSK